jgi:GST-like protein
MVNRSWGPLERQLHERHDATDFDLRTQDKLAAGAQAKANLTD